MATIRRKNDKWHVQIRRKGIPPTSRSFERQSDAKEWSRLMDLRADRKDLSKDARELDTIILGDLIERYIKEIVTRKTSGEMETIVLNAFRRDKICKKALSAITIEDWNKYRDARLKTIKPISLKRILSPIQNMFAIAIEEWGVPLKENPISKLKLPVDDNKRQRRLRDGEQAKLLKAAEGTRAGYLQQVIVIALETGMRRGEILRIQRGNINLGRSLLCIPLTKNGEARTIPLTPLVRATLEERMRQVPERDGLLFKTSEMALRLSWDRVRKKVELNDLHFHDLRHEAISLFLNLG